MIAPEGSSSTPRSPAAVVAGNVETSSRVADLVLAAFGRALGQGTMNNVVLGTEDFTYYETLGGGQGACPDADGPSARPRRDVATRSTRRSRRSSSSSRCASSSTPSGAAAAATGAHRGGDGVVREYEMLEDMELSLLTERRRHAPPGADGGEPGAKGRNLLDGEELPPKAKRDAARRAPRLRIETPGGGGHGAP